MMLITSNLDKVRSNIFIVLCVSGTSEFQGVFAKEFQFDEIEYWEGGICGMADSNYVLRYLPSFYEDLEQKAMYIVEKLQNPQAANELIDSVEKAILDRKPNAEAFERYHSINERKYPYYRIYVKNYVIYYVVIDDDGQNKIMEVRRFLYNRQNFMLVI